MKEKVLVLIETWSFRIVALFLVLLETILILKGEWAGDFWEHAAVIKELSEQFMYPDNPIIKAKTPHAFFSPYSLLVAAFSRLTGLSSILSLAWFAFFNLLFFIYAFYGFCRSVFRGNHHLIAALSLLLILFFNGEQPFRWSGFYHIIGLNYVLPYPSTFAQSLSFLVLAMVAKGDVSIRSWKNVCIILLSSIVFITHPTTAIFLFTAITSLNLSLVQNSIIKGLSYSALFILPAIALALAWPYFSMIDLLFGNGDDFHQDSQLLYSNVLQQNWPVLFALPALFLKKDKTARFFIWAILFMLLILVIGYMTKVYGFSRLISGVLMFAHFLIAYLVVRHLKEPIAYSKLYLLILGTAILISLYLNRHRYLYPFNIFRKRDTAYYEKFSFLKFNVASDDVVLSDAESSFILISYNGKAISSKRPLYWVADIKERREAVDAFFNPPTPDAQRKFILQKYRPDYLLIDHAKVRFEDPTAVWLRQMGKIVYYKDQLELIRLQ